MRVSQPPLQDPEIFSNLYARTQIIIFRYIYGMQGGSIEEVEDLTCDTFLRAWKGRNRFWGDDQDALYWLFTIARHLIIDNHRRENAHPETCHFRLDDANVDNIFLSTQVTPEDQASRREQYKRLWIILQNLSNDKREVLVLRYFLGWKVKQIANYKHKEENTISVSIRRCLKQIRQDWAKE